MKNWVLTLTLLTTLLSLSSHAYGSKVVCYYGSWGVRRDNSAEFDISSIDPNSCTHIIYSFAGLRNGVMVPLNPASDQPDNFGKNGYGQLFNLKNQNPNLKIAIAMGGWEDGSAEYSKAVSTDSSRSTLANSILNNVLKYNSDGFDLDWEFPGQEGGAPADKENLVLFLQELKQKLESYGKELSITVSTNVNTAPLSYDVAGIAANVDFINLMNYDIYFNFSVLGHNAPFSKSTADDNLNALSTIQYWLRQGAPSEKLILGIPFYGRSFISSHTAVGSETSGPGPSGPYTEEPGFLSYLEMCEKFNQSGWLMMFDSKQTLPYAYNKNTKEWITYDDEKSICFKTSHAMQMSLGGVVIWSIDYDDTTNICGKGSYPLLNAVKHFSDYFSAMETDPEITLQYCYDRV